MPEPVAAEPTDWDELLPVLDEELSRLPDRYRAVVVLCDLEGRTRKEAAQQLGVPEGTVAGWIARARVMLAGRLTRRGLALPGGASAVILSQNVASAGIPASVVSKTIKVASLLAMGRATTGEISVTVAALTEGVLRTMFLSKLKMVVGAMMVVVVLIGSGAAISLGQPSNSPMPKTVDPEATQAKAAAGKRETPTPQPALTSGPDLEVGKAYAFSLPIGARKELDGKVVEIRGHWVKVESREEALQYWVNLGTVSVIMPLPGRD